MWDFVKFLFGCLLLFLFLTNFGKMVKIGNHIIDKTYEVFVEEPDTIK